MTSKLLAPRFPKISLKVNSNFDEIVFVHIPKTAGTSIINHLFKRPVSAFTYLAPFPSKQEDIGKVINLHLPRPMGRLTSAFYHYMSALDANQNGIFMKY